MSKRYADPVTAWVHAVSGNEQRERARLVQSTNRANLAFRSDNLELLEAFAATNSQQNHASLISNLNYPLDDHS